MSCNVCVVGSVNMDLVVRAARFPRPGETLIGEGFEVQPGGKGANQAVAASRMGANVSLVGCIGDDDWGSQLRGVLTAEGVDIHNVRKVERMHSGVGVITIIPGGENTVVVASGANAKFSPADVDEAAKEIRAADVLVLQAEVPSETNARAIEIAKQTNTQVIFNAAPAVGLDPALLAQVDVLVANRDEARTLVGDDERDITPAGLARRLASLGPERVVVTLGAEGAIHFNGQEVKSFEGFDVECVDSTAAGDAFVGALAVLRCEDARLKESVRYACAAGGLATTVVGAISAMPTREKVEELLRKD